MNQKATQKKPSEILPSLLGCYQDILLNNTKRRRPFGFKGQLEIADRLGPAFGREMIYSFNDRRMRRTNIRFEFIMCKPSL
jgi:hypothetical protein